MSGRCLACGTRLDEGAIESVCPACHTVVLATLGHTRRFACVFGACPCGRAATLLLLFSAPGGRGRGRVRRRSAPACQWCVFPAPAPAWAAGHTARVRLVRWS